jgi:hypothetical protein
MVNFNVLVTPSAQLIEQIQVKDPYLLDCLRALSGESLATQAKVLSLFQSLTNLTIKVDNTDNYDDLFLLMGA